MSADFGKAGINASRQVVFQRLHLDVELIHTVFDTIHALFHVIHALSETICGCHDLVQPFEDQILHLPPTSPHQCTMSGGQS
ncbi:MAG TPA: hypothetical protein VD969_21610 [Symbiobacteriaceae bacterium]|nr:hypothetical protein [Symbiobacteriaceae bacterium]